MLIELLVFLIEKGFVRNQHPLYYFMDVYDNVKGAISEQLPLMHKSKPDEEDKFSKKKFIKVFKQIAKKFYPCDSSGF